MKLPVKLFVRLQLFLGDRRGATAIEYCLLAGLIAIGLVGALSSMGESANGMFLRANEGFNRTPA